MSVPAPLNILVWLIVFVVIVILIIIVLKFLIGVLVIAPMATATPAAYTETAGQVLPSQLGLAREGFVLSFMPLFSYF